MPRSMSTNGAMITSVNVYTQRLALKKSQALAYKSVAFHAPAVLDFDVFVTSGKLSQNLCQKMGTLSLSTSDGGLR